METGGGRLRPALYGAGALGASLLLQTILLWIVYFYAPPAGQGAARLSPALVGLALAGGRVINALSNPPVAFWSDSVRGRWGRRRPFIAFGAPVLVACFMLLWIPPAAPAVATFLYALLVLAGFFFCFSLVMNPYAAMLPDITRSGRGRVAAASWQAGASLGGVGAAMIVSPWLITHAGFGTMGVVLGLGGLAMLWVVAAGVHEPPTARHSAGARAAGFLGSFAGVTRNRAFAVFTLSLTLLWLGTSMVNSSIVFVITVLMGLPRDQVGIVLGTSFACTVAAFPLLTRVTRALGAPRTMVWTLAAASAVVPLIGAIGLPGVPFTPVVQGYALVLLVAAPLASLLVLPNTILADIAEADRIGTGEGHEAMFYAVQGLVLNGATALSSVILGGLLTLGDSPGQTLGLRLIPVAAGGSTLLALLAFLRFPRAFALERRGATSRSAV